LKQLQELALKKQKELREAKNKGKGKDEVVEVETAPSGPENAEANAELEKLMKAPTSIDMVTNQASEKTQAKSKGKVVGRNDLCPCGSGKKYKQCCGKNAK